MRDPIENVTRLQKQLNNLQLENQVLKNILDKERDRHIKMNWQV